MKSDDTNVMVKVRYWRTDWLYEDTTPTIRYYGPGRSRYARQKAEKMRERGFEVQVLIAPIGQWEEVAW